MFVRTKRRKFVCLFSVVLPVALIGVLIVTLSNRNNSFRHIPRSQQFQSAGDVSGGGAAEPAVHLEARVVDPASTNRLPGSANPPSDIRNKPVLDVGRLSLASDAPREQSRQCSDVDCTDFHRLLNERWPPNKPRGVVVLLIGPRTVSSNGDLFRSFAKQFDENFNSAFNYPVIIFHEPGDVNETDKRNLRVFTNSTLYFQRVDFRLPPFINESLISRHCRNGLDSFGLGYRHMCRFMAKSIYDEPILAVDKLDYIWRLDDDSVLTRPLEYDIFQYMQDHRLQYGYALVNDDDDDCVYGLEEAVKQYCKHKNVTPSFVWRMPKIVYNNFEVSQMSLWRSTAYKDFIDFIDLEGGIYYNRWGDAPIKSLAVSILLSEDKVHQFNDIGYRHYLFSTTG